MASSWGELECFRLDVVNLQSDKINQPDRLRQGTLAGAAHVSRPALISPIRDGKDSQSITQQMRRSIVDVGRGPDC